jgi:predicted GNAT family N-acyltransferase
VLTTANNRGRGPGRELLVEGIARAERQYPGHRIRIGAQLYLERFYSDPAVVRYAGDKPFTHIDQARQWIASVMQQ